MYKNYSLLIHKKNKGPHLFGKLLSCFEVEVSSQTSKKTNNELASLCHSVELWQTIEHCTHQTSLHDKIILMKEREEQKGMYKFELK